MITQKENYLNVINHGDPVWTPLFGIDCAGVGFGAGPGPAFEKGPIGGGLDGFGVRWVAPSSGGGAAIPAPGEFLIDDYEKVEDWKKYVKFPNPEEFDWEDYAKHDPTGLDAQNIDRNQVALDWGSGNGPYERLAALMGFENALLAMAAEPEATRELVDAIVDWKIELLPYVKKYFAPDLYTSYDDFCTERAPFMSVDMFNDLFLQPTKRYFDAVKAEGMIPVQHTCGYATPLVDSFIETGAQAWTSVQACNDVDALLTKYGDRFTFIGGWDSNGPASMPDATDEEIIDEVHRCIDTYGGRKGYVFFGFRLVDSLDPQIGARENMRVFMTAFQYALEKAGIPMPQMG